MGTIKVKSPTIISAHYKDSAARAGTNYKEGVKGVDWKTPAASQAAEDLYAANVQAAIAVGRRMKQIALVANSDWEKNAETKGATNIVGGIAGAVDKQAKGYAPYGQALNGMSIPDRVADGYQNFLNRAGAVVQAEIAKKKEIKG